MDTRELREILGETDVFAGVPAEVLEALLAAGTVESTTCGTALFHEGEPGQDLFLVLSGAIELTTSVRRAGEQRLALLDRGQIFGELACFDDLPRSATATAFVDAVVWRLPGPGLDVVLDRTPSLAATLLRNLVKKVSLRLRDADQEIRELRAAAQP
ncbi:MAG: cyclic nucleotide-binding domain-containing protein [Candidatus Sericytochromatia bacterium]|nr:cyclic nucleotide-binding domain-containing protein [Candidatus Sericytochromatia bacterium]